MLGTQHKSQFSAEKYVYENIWIVPRKHEKLKFGKLGIFGFASTQKKKVRPGMKTTSELQTNDQHTVPVEETNGA